MSDYSTYRVTVSFGGYIGCEEEYEVYARDEEEATYLALEQAYGDLSVDSVEETDED